MAQLDVLICAQASIKNFSLVNKPAYLISPKFSGPEVGLRSEDNYFAFLWNIYFLYLCNDGCAYVHSLLYSKPAFWKSLVIDFHMNEGLYFWLLVQYLKCTLDFLVWTTFFKQRYANLQFFKTLEFLCHQ